MTETISLTELGDFKVSRSTAAGGDALDRRYINKKLNLVLIKMLEKCDGNMTSPHEVTAAKQ